MSMPSMPSFFLTQSGRGTPLLLLHGWGFDHRIWDSLVSKLNSTYQVYRVDLPGFGKTDMMPWAQFEKALLAKIPHPTVLLGWSMGGLIATHLALKYPGHFSQVIQVTSSPHFIAHDTWPGISHKHLNIFQKNLQHAPEATHEGFMSFQVPESLRRKLAPIETPSVKSLEHGFEILCTWDFRDQLHKLTCPTTYCFGQRDVIVPEATLHAMKARHPNFNYHLFPESGHTPFLSHSDAFIGFLHQCVTDAYI